MRAKRVKLIWCAVCVVGAAVSFFGGFAAHGPARAAAQSPQAAKVDFARDIQPLFAAACNHCHGAKKAASQLRLDVKALALKGGLSGAVIVPGNSRDSRLMQRLRGEGGEQRMPLGGEALTPEQIDLVRRWIDEGAAWPEDNQSPISNLKSEIPQHWAYVKPTRPALPEVKNRAWVRNAIDRFILARLEKEGLAFAPEADRATLLRRVSLDLTGLPPSVQEVDAFLSDASNDAYEKAVDRLLASPHYGERWARPWLDLARYADSNGYEKDRPRVIWKYRDWVIDALNRDLPFDRFTVEQIAGDMLPEATNEQRIATGFHRNTLLNEEGGADPEEAMWTAQVDRVSTTATVWLGSTLACAQCHNHKYDPFTQKDFYRLLAFFDNNVYRAQANGSQPVFVEPVLELPTPEQEAKRKIIQDEIAKLEASLQADAPASAQAAWERAVLDERDNWTTLDPAEFKSTGGTRLEKLDDKSLLAGGANPEKDSYLITAQSGLGKITGLRVEALADVRLPRGGPGRDPYGNFLLTGVEVTAAPANNPAQAERIVLSQAGADDSVGFDTEVFVGMEGGLRRNGVPKGWPIDATRDAARLNRQAVFTFTQPVGFPGGTILKIRLNHLAGTIGQGIGRVRLSVTGCDDPPRIIALPAKARPALLTPPPQRTEEQKKEMAAQYRALAPEFKARRDRLSELRQSLKSLGIATTLVLGERQTFERPSTFLRVRGGFLNKGEKVYAGVPAALHPLPEHAPVNRLGLAYWLVDENNPLTARVAVNRFWEQIFGRGIVETSEDFGSQGAPPSHPELLDWLATEFVAQKWSMKSLVRLIVTSAAYRQSSRVTPELQARDPYNRLLARGPRFRVEAEMIRDAALAASGLLSRKIGGPSVFPPQPDGIWAVSANSDNDRWLTSTGADRFRRGLYTFIRRSAPYPAMMNFDATSRESCTVRRTRTNTPLQALTLLNDEAFFEIARGLARRMIDEGGADAKARLAYGFRLCVTRAPRAEELARLVKLYEQQLAHYRARPAEAAQLIAPQLQPSDKAGAAELAAWTVAANVLLNLDATLTKE
jgi:mono/diheme cytochrome c family protein